MVHAAGELAALDIEAYLAEHESKSMLRFITCGSVDDGKSTLIGRMLYESHLVFEDHLAALEYDSRQVGTQGGDLDFALLVDGLSAEREQGITIDVAYRFFTTENRKFIVADTPGHEQYTRNMVTGASTTELAVILIDARKGVVTQTRRHSYLVNLLGIEHVVLAVNKLDLVDFDRATFDAIEADYRAFGAEIGIGSITAIPVSALRGDNIVVTSAATPWYTGPTLLGHLETVDVSPRSDDAARFRMPVQWVNRPNADFRGFAGVVTGGRVRVGDPVAIAPKGTSSRVARISTFDGDLDEAIADQSVTILLDDEVDVSRGDVLAAASDPVGVADQFEAHVVWMHENEMHASRPYLMKLGAMTVGFTVTDLKYKVDVNTLEQLAANTLGLNEIGLCEVAADRPVAFTPYSESRDLGGFIIIDRISNATVGAGLIRRALHRRGGLGRQHVEVTPESRAAIMGHDPTVIWLTGLPGAGKSTIAEMTEQRLHALGIHTMLLNGETVRDGLNRDLGFTTADQVESVRRVAELARLMVDAGLVVIVAFTSPLRAERLLAREVAGPGRFIEVFVDARRDAAEERDLEGLNVGVRLRAPVSLPGIDSPFESPESPEVHVDADSMTPEDAVDAIFDLLRDRVLGGP